MKKCRLIIFLLIAALTLSVSCAKEKEPAPAPQKHAISFKRLAEATFGEGTKIGVFVKTPSYENVLLTVGADGALTTSQEMFWNEEQTEKSLIVAYAPYQEGVTSTADLPFTVQADQSTEAGLKASDLTVAVLEADPTQENYQLAFEHKMTQAKIYFQNNTGETIKSVEFSQIATTQKFGIWTGEGAVSNPSTIKAFAEGNCYKAYFPAQSASMKIKVTTESSDTYEFELESNDYQAGKVYSNSNSPIAISKAAPKSIQLSFSVSDWTDGGQLKIKGDTPTPTPGETAVLTYSEAKGTYNYNELKRYTNEYGTWEICCYSNNSETTGFQLNSSSYTKVRLSYIGTPDFDDVIKAVKINSTADYTENIFICSEGKESTDVRLLTVKGSGQENYIDVSALGLTKLYIMSYRQLNISSITIELEKSAPIEETAFTQTTVPGFYTSTTSAPASRLSIEEQEQYSCGKTSSGRTLTIADFANGNYWIFNLSAASLSIGGTYAAELDENGSRTNYPSLSCVKKTATKVWLEDKSNGTGFIIPIE